MTVICPCDDVETIACIKAAAEYKGPVYIRLGRSAVPTLNDEGTYRFQIGKSVKLRDGKDITIFATGIMVSEAMKAAEELTREGIEAEVINVHTLKPIDAEGIVDSVKKTGAAITCEEHNVIGGLGSAVCEVLAENHPATVKRVGVMDTFGESGKPSDLLKKYGLLAENIIHAVRETIKRK